MSNKALERSPDDRTVMVSAARMFYLQDLNKSEIATELGVSRFKIARLLEAARETGLVQITINDHGASIPHLAQDLKEALELDHAVVVEAPIETANSLEVVGRAAANRLGDTLEDGEILGLAWGRTLTAMSSHLPPLPRVDVVQLTGAIGNDLEASPVEITRRVALSSGGSAIPIFAPLLVNDSDMADALRAQADVAQVFNMFNNLTTAVVSVGSIKPATSQVWNSLDRYEQDRLQKLNTVAEVVAAFVDASGNEVDPELTKRCIAITPSQLRRVPRVIAAAAGADKAHALLAVARGKLCTEVVTDRSLATEILSSLREGSF